MQQAADAQRLGGHDPSHYLDASNIAGGTLSAARLPADVALRSATNRFSGSNLFAQIDATVIRQGGSAVCDASNNCGYATAAQLATALKQGGNAFGAPVVTGSNDNQDVSIRANGVEAIRIPSTGPLTLSRPGATALNINAGNTRFGLRVGDAALGRWVSIGYANSTSPFAPAGAEHTGYIRGSVTAGGAGGERGTGQARRGRRPRRHEGGLGLELLVHVRRRAAGHELFGLLHPELGHRLLRLGALDGRVHAVVPDRRPRWRGRRLARHPLRAVDNRDGPTGIRTVARPVGSLAC